MMCISCLNLLSYRLLTFRKWLWNWLMNWLWDWIICLYTWWRKRRRTTSMPFHNRRSLVRKLVFILLFDILDYFTTLFLFDFIYLFSMLGGTKSIFNCLLAFLKWLKILWIIHTRLLFLTLFRWRLYHLRLDYQIRRSCNSNRAIR